MNNDKVRKTKIHYPEMFKAYTHTKMVELKRMLCDKLQHHRSYIKMVLPLCIPSRISHKQSNDLLLYQRRI